MALHAESQGNELRLTWNRHAPILANATRGILVIEDGDQPKRELPLTAALLQSGSVLYQPRSNRVRFRLDVRSTQSASIVIEAPPGAKPEKRAAAQLTAAPAPAITGPGHTKPTTRPPMTSDESDAERVIVPDSGTRGRVQPLPSDVQESHDTGIATYYNYSGESDKQTLAAAYPRMPVGSRVRVTNLANGRSIVLPIIRPGATSRGKHIINVSYHAAEELGFVRAGTARVRVEPE